MEKNLILIGSQTQRLSIAQMKIVAKLRKGWTIVPSKHGSGKYRKLTYFLKKEPFTPEMVNHHSLKVLFANKVIDKDGLYLNPKWN